MQKIILSTYLIFCVINLTAQIKENFNMSGKVAIDGFDPVSYFEGKPVRGKEEFKYKYNGIYFWFKSEKNKQSFLSQPEKYIPAYGGWCAYAMGKNGDKVKIDPYTYKIIDGRIYLFYNFDGNNTLLKWNKKESKLKEKADRNWKELLNQQ
ncbi:MAG: YHS domain-containing (seleno)protein [Fulvivirga sp.]|nr:YHS domain-containing (seleno)protein [Fulvivirga sp.]